MRSARTRRACSRRWSRLRSRPDDRPVARGPAVRPGSAAAWSAATRPRSLLIAFSPVLVGAALGWARTGAIDAAAALLVLAAALLMQLITNLQNDVGYTLRGAERSGTRTGLPRATAQGWLGVAQVRVAIVLLSLLAIALGLALVMQRGWPVLAIGVRRRPRAGLHGRATTDRLHAVR